MLTSALPGARMALSPRASWIAASTASMVMLLRDVHYDHLEIGNGHRQRGCSDMEAGNTGQILTEAGPSVHGVCSESNFSEALR